MPTRFYTKSPEANIIAQAHFGALLQLDHIDDMVLEGFHAKLKAIDDAFHASFPRLVHVSAHIVKNVSGKPLRVHGRVHSSVFLRSFAAIASLTKRSLADCLSLLRARIETILQSQCGPQTACIFFEKYAGLFTEEGFDQDKGFSVRMAILETE